MKCIFCFVFFPVLYYCKLTLQVMVAQNKSFGFLLTDFWCMIERLGRSFAFVLSCIVVVHK